MSKASPRRLHEAFRKGGWIAQSDEALNKFLKDLVAEVSAPTGPYGRGAGLIKPVQKFQDFIENNGEMYMGFHQMFDGLPPSKDKPRDYKTLCRMFNAILQRAPYYGDIGPPIYMVMFEMMNTFGGYSTFLSTQLNGEFKKMFKYWTDYLTTEPSRNVLNTTEKGWFGSSALTAMEAHFPGQTFAEIFKCSPSAEFWGYKSWDDFFNRQFNPGVRVTDAPENTKVVVAACESAFYNLRTNVNSFDEFWIKGEPYSLHHLLNHHDLADQFMGGTVFQGFLEVTGYHRWHSPCDGTIREIVSVPGTYFVQSPALLNDTEGNPYLRSLSFITAITARMLIFIDAKDRAIGLMCFVALGMTEISTCEATVRAGDPVTKGQELGMFHFGGSSHCLVFRPETKIKFDDPFTQEPDESESTPHVNVRSAIAVVE